MKQTLLLVFLAASLSVPRLALPQEKVKLEGTIQGLLSTCAGEKCTPQKAVIIAALEDVFVLVSDEDTIYLLPNIKNSVLSRYLNDKVRVTGTLTLEGVAIQVETAEVDENGEWVTFWSPEIKEQIEVERKRLQRKLPLPGMRRRTRQKVGHGR